MLKKNQYKCLARGYNFRVAWYMNIMIWTCTTLEKQQNSSSVFIWLAKLIVENLVVLELKCQEMKMKLFETGLKNFMFFGLEWDERSKKYFFTKKIFFTPSLCIVCFTSCTIFLMYDAKTFYDYILSAVVMLTTVASFAVFIICKLNVNIFNDFIEFSQYMSEESEWTYSYVSFSRQIVYANDSKLWIQLNRAGASRFWNFGCSSQIEWVSWFNE